MQMNKGQKNRVWNARVVDAEGAVHEYSVSAITEAGAKRAAMETHFDSCEVEVSLNENKRRQRAVEES